MTANAIVRASAALLFCMAAVVPGQAQAQNYDGAGLLRFGAFGHVAPTDFDFNEPRDVGGSASDTGFGGGVTYGYDYLFHSGLILGIESDIAFDTMQADRGLRQLSVAYMATVRGRIGSYVRPDLLLYGTAGVSFLGVEYDGLTSPVTGIQFNEDDTLVGWTAGLGAEFDWHGIVFFSEYLFAGYDSLSFNEPLDEVDELGVVSTRFLRNDIDVDQHVFRFGVKFIIGHDFRSSDAYVPVK